MDANRQLGEAELVALVRQIMEGHFSTQEVQDRAISLFTESVPHPRAADLIFHPDPYFDHQPTPKEVVERALIAPSNCDVWMLGAPKVET